MQASDAGTAITRLQELVNRGPGEHPEALKEAQAIVLRLGSHEATGYQSEKLAAVRESFDAWLGPRKGDADGNDPQAFRIHLLQDIDKLRKALARGAMGQD